MLAAAKKLHAGKNSKKNELNSTATISDEALYHNNVDEKKKNRIIRLGQRRMKEQLTLSPSIQGSPRALPIDYTKSPMALFPFANSPIRSRVANGMNSIAPGTPSDSTTLSNIPPKESLEQMNRKFEEWMKITADNKINSKNTWNFALIDYFSELTLLRDGDKINFQKASCTLDGCVKIYSNRVDSVMDEAGKLLNGLSEGKGESTSPSQQLTEDDDEGESSTTKTKKKVTTSRTLSTIEKNPDNLLIKKFDLEYSADPLFRKTSTDFDEAGTSGMLLNNLNISDKGIIIFDSSTISEIEGREKPRYQDLLVDITKMKGKLMACTSMINTLSICKPLEAFSFRKGKLKVSEEMQKLIDKMNLLELQKDSNEIVDEEFPQLGNQNQFDAEDGFNSEFDPEESQNNILLSKTNSNLSFSSLKESTTNAKNLNEIDFVMSLTDSKDSMFSYFDSSMSKVWAGPDHWKIKPFYNKKRTIANKDDSLNVKSTSHKTPTFIDFVNFPAVNIDTLFMKGTQSITLSKAVLAERRKCNNLLPEDLQFSSKDLLRLYSRPNWTFLPKVCRLSSDTTDQVNSLLEKDGSIWQTETLHQEFVENFNDQLLHKSQITNGVTQLSIVEGTDTDFLDDIPTEVPNNFELNIGDSLVDIPKSNKFLRMNYAKVSKKVDIKKLKDVLWTELDETPQGLTSEDNSVKFTQVINNLPQFYKNEELKDISVQFCFICLLHLANEKNLIIKQENPQQATDLVILKK